MKLLKPNWVSHDGGQAIFSIDIHPDGTRFSTGGQAEDGSGKVVIWNMAPVKDSKAESDPQVPKVLTELTNHLGCVNCTRWSRDGKYLASGSDDSIIIIWSLRYKTSGKPVFGLENPVYEQWGCSHMLRGHNGDILDLAWSHDQRHLASCSVDNTIVIWNALKFPEKVNVIETHKGMVKGITWDPVGKYLASQSDDKTIRVWRTSDWSEETKISEPFRNCGGTTHMLRLSWSPDGRFIVSAHSLNNDGPTAHIIDRSTWKTGMDFVGHRKAIEVVKFNPHLFFMGNEGEGLEDERANHGCLAIGSRDRSLSIWLTSYKRPLAVVHELFNNSILDLSWSKDGYDLMACSLDGSVAFVSLTPQELGTSLNGYRLDELFMSLYGLKRLDHKEGFKSNHLIIEDPSMLSANPSLLDGRGGASTSRATPTKVPSTSNQATPNNKMSLVDDLPTIKRQTESRTPDGRRRIKPVMLASLPTIQSSSSSSFSLNDSPFTNSKIMATPPKTTPTKKLQKDEGIEAIKSPPARPITFAPLSPPTGKASSSKPSSSQSLSAAKALIGADKRPLEPDHTPDTQPAAKTKRAKRAKTVSHDDHVTKPRPVTKAAYQLEVPPLVPSLCLQLTTPMGGVSLEVTNDGVGVVKSGILTCKVDDACKWICPLVSPALLIAANEHVTCTCTLDNAMLLVSTATGRLLTSRLLLSAPPYQSKVVSHYVAIATIDACVTVYDVLTMTAIVRRVAFGHVISGSSECVDIELTKTGVPVVVTTRGAHAYHSSMDGWVELSNPMDSSEIYSTSFSLSKPTGAVSSVLPLQSLQEMIHVNKANNSLQSDGSTLAYLESQLFRSATLSSSLEYEQWIKSYVTYLVNKTHTERLREYCIALRTEGTTEGIRPLTVLQCNRAKILNDILTIIATNPNMQRLYGELKEVFESEL